MSTVPIAELVISAALIAGTTFFHAIVVAACGAVFRGAKRNVWGAGRFVRDALMLSLLGVVLAAAHFAEIGMWGAVFLKIGAFETAEPALYFAAVSYTTLGFGDIILDEQWRLLSGAAAANGLLLFGLSAAFMVETAGKLRLAGS